MDPSVQTGRDELSTLASPGSPGTKGMHSELPSSEIWFGMNMFIVTCITLYIPYYLTCLRL